MGPEGGRGRRGGTRFWETAGRTNRIAEKEESDTISSLPRRPEENFREGGRRIKSLTRLHRGAGRKTWTDGNEVERLIELRLEESLGCLKREKWGCTTGPAHGRGKWVIYESRPRWRPAKKEKVQRRAGQALFLEEGICAGRGRRSRMKEGKKIL